MHIFEAMEVISGSFINSFVILVLDIAYMDILWMATVEVVLDKGIFHTFLALIIHKKYVH